MRRVFDNLAWIWMIMLVVINIVPIGNDANRSLSSNQVAIFRLDYLLHSIMILGFAWIWVFSRIRRHRYFISNERLKFLLIVLCAGIGLELLQLLVPWRSFNPVDMYYNLFGAGFAVLIVICCPG